MKRFLLSLTSALSVISLVAGQAAAQSADCTISNTGSGSINVANCKNKSQFTIKCTNNTVVYVNNKQTANSGSSVTVNNTNGSFSTSTGSAVNVNSSNVAENVSCAPAKQAAATTPSPSSTSKGASSSPTPAPATVQALPNTGSDSLVNGGVIAALALVLVALATRFGLVAYRRATIKR